MALGVAHKRRPQSGRVVLCGQVGSSDADVRTFCCKKQQLQFMVCPHWQGGRGSIFCDFVRTFIWTAPLWNKI